MLPPWVNSPWIWGKSTQGWQHCSTCWQVATPILTSIQFELVFTTRIDCLTFAPFAQNIFDLDLDRLLTSLLDITLDFGQWTLHRQRLLPHLDIAIAPTAGKGLVTKKLTGIPYVLTVD